MTVSMAENTTYSQYYIFSSYFLLHTQSLIINTTFLSSQKWCGHMTEFWLREHKWKLLCATSGNIFKDGACFFLSPSFFLLPGWGRDRWIQQASRTSSGFGNGRLLWWNNSIEWSWVSATMKHHSSTRLTTSILFFCERETDTFLVWATVICGVPITCSQI